VRRYSPDPKFFSADEVERLLAAARQHGPVSAAIVLLGVDAGLRCGEMTALRWGDLSDGWITVARSRSPYGEEGPTKSGRTRQVPLTARLVAALGQLPRSDEDDHVLLIDGGPANHTTAAAG
jgi:integrase